MWKQDRNVTLHYTDLNDHQHSFSFRVASNISLHEFIQKIVSSSTPFEKLPVGDISLRKSTSNEQQAPLSPHDSINDLIRNRKIWIIRKYTIIIFYVDENGEECKTEPSFWEDELSSKNLRDRVQSDLSIDWKDYEIIAKDPNDNMVIKIVDNSNIKSLLSRNCRFQLRQRRLSAISHPSPIRTSSGHGFDTLLTPVVSPVSTASDIHFQEFQSLYIHYIVNHHHFQYKITIPANITYIDLVRKIMEDAPKEYKGAFNSDSAITLTGPHVLTPGDRKFLQEDMQDIYIKKLWLVRKKTVSITLIEEGEQLEVHFKFFPEQEFGYIKWAVASYFGKDVDSFELFAKNLLTGEFNRVHLQLRLEDFPNHTFFVKRPRNTSIGRKDADLWACAHGCNSFDYFFSHRTRVDKDAVEVFHNALNGFEYPPGSKHIIHTFWDRKCLVSGGKWEEGFLSALKQSKIAVLFLSNESLEKIRNADVEPDNMFLEWETCLQMYPSRNIVIFPIIIGRKAAFQGFNMTFPDRKHCHDRSPGILSIKDVMKEIFAFQAEEIDLTKIEHTKTKLLNILSKVIRTVNSNQPAPLDTLLLNQAELDNLAKQLKPLYHEMENERTRLLKSHVDGTRLWLLRSLAEFLNPENSAYDTERVLWLQGNAGVGKSVMAALCSEGLERRNLLGGMFFAKHDDAERKSPQNLLRTLCFQLCRWNADFGRSILHILTDEGLAAEILSDKASVEKMFTHLILNPLLEIAVATPNHHPIVLVVDALDETGNIGSRREILQVFSLHCKKLPAFIKVLITSRPEPDIVKTFSDLPTKTLNATDEENLNDAKIFAFDFLQKQNFPEEILDYGANLLTSKSGGLFLWLAMACRNLAILGNVTLESIEALNIGGSDTAMDALYTSTFDRIFHDSPREPMNTVISAIALAYEPLKMEDYAFLLDIPLLKIQEIVSKLLPVLYVDESTEIRFFHKSVADYLTNPSRCTDLRFAVKSADFHVRLTNECVRVLERKLCFNIAKLPPYMRNKDITNLAQLVSQHVPEYLRYSALYFWKHWAESDSNFNHGISVIMKEFLSEKLLNWIELLSILKTTSIIPTAVTTMAENYTPLDYSDYTIELLSDTIRLYQKFNVPISTCALQIYISAIPFSPTETQIYRHYFHRLPTRQIPNVIVGAGTKWQSCLTNLEGHSATVYSVAVSSDGRFIATGSWDTTLKIWSMQSGEKLKTLRGHTDNVNSVAFTTDGRYIVSGSSDKTIKIWVTESGEDLRTLSGHTNNVNAVAVSTDGLFIVSGSLDNTIKIWSFDSGDEVLTLYGHSDSVRTVAISVDGQYIVSGSNDKTIKLWSTLSGEVIGTLTGHTDIVRSVAISSNNQYIISGSWDNTIKVWSFQSGQMERSIQAHTNNVKSVAVSVDGWFIVSGGGDNTVKIWVLESGELFRTFKGHNGGVNTAVISSDGQYIVSGSLDNSVKIWSMQSDEEVVRSKGHTLKVNALTISRDGKLMVSGSDDKTVKVWSTETGELLKTLSGHSNPVYSVEISRDGHFVMSGGFTNQKIEYDLRTDAIVDIETNFDRYFSSYSVSSIVRKNLDKWDGWIVVDGSMLFWMPREFRHGVKNGLHKRRYCCVGIGYVGIVDFSALLSTQT
ncbi:hypothetical protein HK098_003054 [Nowakowskiella sp. JEL0407]|nr:hypothetical protein HK098_003054 [Nowakowskiella sp. JEL0407]